jgi:hypothetical protein
VAPESIRKIQLNRIAHVFYTHKNFDGQRKFLLDFGFAIAQEEPDRIFFKGYGTQPFAYCLSRGEADKFGGAAFVVETLEDLEHASQTLPGASSIYDVDAPGGGKGVTFTDPVDGFPFHLVHGQALKELSTHLPELPFNFPTSKHREVSKTQRFRKGPASVHKLGHFGLCVTDFAKTYAFYSSRFNFKASDLVYDPATGEDMTCFFHLDRGLTPVDHHSFFIFAGPKFHVHHSSFEVHDFDAQSLGHDWLRDQGWENCWGVGRHVMGSQIFDYWFDASPKPEGFEETKGANKFILEHYIDGDVVDSRTETNREKAAPGNLHVWGPDLPPTFMM